MLAILPSLKRLGVPIVLLTGNPKSALARQCDVVLDVSVAEEACPMNLAPTSSTTAALAIGDALAMALLELRGAPSGGLRGAAPARRARLARAVPRRRPHARRRHAAGGRRGRHAPGGGGGDDPPRTRSAPPGAPHACGMTTVVDGAGPAGRGDHRRRPAPPAPAWQPARRPARRSHRLPGSEDDRRRRPRGQGARSHGRARSRAWSSSTRRSAPAVSSTCTTSCARRSCSPQQRRAVAARFPF